MLGEPAQEAEQVVGVVLGGELERGRDRGRLLERVGCLRRADEDRPRRRSAVAVLHLPAERGDSVAQRIGQGPVALLSGGGTLVEQPADVVGDGGGHERKYSWG